MKFNWTQDGVNNGEPAWRLVVGDYEAIVLKGYGMKEVDTHLWSFRVNNNGRMNLSSAEEGKALAEQFITADIVRRQTAAAKTIELFGPLEVEE